MNKDEIAYYQIAYHKQRAKEIAYDRQRAKEIAYYRQRAKEYEQIYAKPERQADLQAAATIITDSLAQKTVLEIACGTGYWTERIARKAVSVYATDINDTVIDIARTKDIPTAKVRFGIEALFHLNADYKYESLFGGFIWSHIPLQELDHFISRVNSLIVPGGTVVFIDNNYVEGSNHPITETDNYGNTYQTRQLTDGTKYLVLKNFPSEVFLKQSLIKHATAIRYYDLKYYWIITYQIVA